MKGAVSGLGEGEHGEGRAHLWYDTETSAGLAGIWGTVVSTMKTTPSGGTMGDAVGRRGRTEGEAVVGEEDGVRWRVAGGPATATRTAGT